MKNISMESLAPNLIVDSVNDTVNYYIKNLGFNLIVSVPEEGVFNWAMIQRDGITLMFQSLAGIQEDLPALGFKSKGMSGTFFIEMTGIDKFYAEVRTKVEIALEMRTTFYGKREFVVKDLNGYFMMFAEDSAGG